MAGDQRLSLQWSAKKWLSDNHHVCGVLGCETVVFVVRDEGDDGEEVADDEEEDGHDEQDDVAVGGYGA